MDNIFDKFYLISKNILNAYRTRTSTYEEVKKLIKLETDEYKKTDIKTIFKLFDYLIYKNDCLDMLESENYEVAFYNNDKNLIIKRMYNKINQIMNRYYTNEENLEKIKKDLYKIDDNLIIVMQNMTGAFDDLERKILTNIETKYLYFMYISQAIDNNKKTVTFINTIYVDPYLEEKLFVPIIMIDEFIKNEDNLYYNLWKNVRENYELFISEYCIDTIYYTIEKMVSETDLDENTILRFMYLRSLLNYLDYETIDELEEEYIESKLEINNPYGEELVSTAFKFVAADDAIIRKIKTR